MVTNGRVPITQLTAVFPSARLLNPVAVAVRNMVLIGALEGTRVTAAGKYAAGYRDYADQVLYKQASQGNVSAIRKLRSLGTVIDSSMKTTVGTPGYQSHGFADRIDLLFNGHSPDASDLALVRRYGGRQEFGDDDRNHIWFAPSKGVSDTDKNRLVAAWLNTRDLGMKTSTEDDGVWPAESKFSRMLQTYGRTVPNWYPAGVYKLDGIRGNRTVWIRDQIWSRLWKS